MSLPYQVVITEPAEADLRSIGAYITYDLLNPGAARATLSAIAASILALEQWPFRHDLVRDERLAAKGIRTLSVRSYLVFYIASEEESLVTIIRILFGKRQWEHFL